ncbi:MAG: DAK2 domain-containing protein [Thermoleophilia bacterium]|jgi:dihydroxyacetone kinase-like protein|nr:DAK2 domain-containing protein [Thermoleophilia bacterium]
MSETVSTAGIAAWLRAFAATVAEARDHLTELDAAIGDADHGVNMDRGMQAVLAKLDGLVAGGTGALLKGVGMTLVSTVGGAAGPLYGTLFLQMGKAAGEESPGSEVGEDSPGPDVGEESPPTGGTPGATPGFTLQQWARVVGAGVAGVQARGKAEVGDKTMVDALVPAAAALRAAAAAGAAAREALSRAADAAERGMQATIPLVARKGRASYLGERSAGHQDPGATSAWLLMRTAAETLAGGEGTAADDPEHPEA